MSRSGDGGASDREPIHGACDVCGHPHACYVGGRPTYDARGDVVLWERQVCLGCLMRAGTPGGFDGCAECDAHLSPAADREFGHA